MSNLMWNILSNISARTFGINCAISATGLCCAQCRLPWIIYNCPACTQISKSECTQCSAQSIYPDILFWMHQGSQPKIRHINSRPLYQCTSTVQSAWTIANILCSWQACCQSLTLCHIIMSGIVLLWDLIPVRYLDKRQTFISQSFLGYSLIYWLFI